VRTGALTHVNFTEGLRLLNPNGGHEDRRSRQSVVLNRGEAGANFPPTITSASYAASSVAMPNPILVDKVTIATFRFSLGLTFSVRYDRTVNGLDEASGCGVGHLLAVRGDGATFVAGPEYQPRCQIG
jgi:hypothetical protein